MSRYLAAAAAVLAIITAAVLPTLAGGQTSAPAAKPAAQQKMIRKRVRARVRKRVKVQYLATAYVGRVSIDNGSNVALGYVTRHCIALRRPVRGERFLLSIGRHHTTARQCDWGPGIMFRVIDIHSDALADMGINWDPTDHVGSARLILSHWVWRWRWGYRWRWVASPAPTG